MGCGLVRTNRKNRALHFSCAGLLITVQQFWEGKKKGWEGVGLDK